MASETKDVNVAQYKEETQLREVPALESYVTALAKSGGFDFLESVVGGLDNMNPVRKAKRDIFKEPGKKKQRAELKKKMQMWIDLLSENSSVAEMVEKAEERSVVAEG